VDGLGGEVVPARVAGADALPVELSICRSVTGSR
jgi:hypothetical protein